VSEWLELLLFLLEILHLYERKLYYVRLVYTARRFSRCKTWTGLT